MNIWEFLVWVYTHWSGFIGFHLTLVLVIFASFGWVAQFKEWRLFNR